MRHHPLQSRRQRVVRCNYQGYWCPTFEPVNDPESGGVFAIRMWSGSRAKGLCNQDQRVLIVAVPEHFELHRKSTEDPFLFRMAAYLDNTCGKEADGFQLFVSKLYITETGPGQNKNGLY